MPIVDPVLLVLNLQMVAIEFSHKATFYLKSAIHIAYKE